MRTQNCNSDKWKKYQRMFENTNAHRIIGRFSHQHHGISGWRTLSAYGHWLTHNCMRAKLHIYVAGVWREIMIHINAIREYARLWMVVCTSYVPVHAGSCDWKNVRENFTYINRTFMQCAYPRGTLGQFENSLGTSTRSMVANCIYLSNNGIFGQCTGDVFRKQTINFYKSWIAVVRDQVCTRQCAIAASSVKITCSVATVLVRTLSSFQVSSRVAHTSAKEYYIEKVYVEKSTHAANYIGTYVGIVRLWKRNKSQKRRINKMKKNERKKKYAHWSTAIKENEKPSFFFR